MKLKTHSYKNLQEPTRITIIVLHVCRPIGLLAVKAIL